jgi:glycosyltransferase involved in cell wall biosynthesis
MTVNEQQKQNGERAYKFGFVLNMTVGNMTRYQNLRKYAERDREVDCRWAPVSHYTPPDFPSRLRFLPEPLFMRARVLQQAWPVLGRLSDLDAVMVHLFEADILCSLRSYFDRRLVHVSSTDEAPIVDRSTYPLYPNELAKPPWRHKLRLALDRWRVRHTDQFIPFSEWVANILVDGCGAPAQDVHALHVGLDLDIWCQRPRPERPADSRLRILFVGGDFLRKGGDLLLDVFRTRFEDCAELQLVSRQAPDKLPPHVHVHADFHPNDERLTELYAQADLLVVPTLADISPWVFLEAMAMGLPVIGTDTGAIREFIHQGETGFVIGVGDGAALGAAIETLQREPLTRRRMGRAGRALVEAEYSASRNVPRILAIMKRAVDARSPALRAGSSSRRAGRGVP